MSLGPIKPTFRSCSRDDWHSQSSSGCVSVAPDKSWPMAHLVIDACLGLGSLALPDQLIRQPADRGRHAASTREDSVAIPSDELVPCLLASNGIDQNLLELLDGFERGVRLRVGRGEEVFQERGGERVGDMATGKVGSRFRRRSLPSETLGFGHHSRRRPERTFASSIVRSTTHRARGRWSSTISYSLLPGPSSAFLTIWS